MAALLAAEDRARDLHPLEDVLVPPGCPDDLAAGGLDHRPQAAVRQDRDDQPAAVQGPPGEPVEGEQADELVPVDDPAAGVDGDTAIRIAVEGEADVRTSRGDGGRQRRRRRRPAAEVDVHAVRVVVDDLHGRARRGQDLRRDDPARAVRAVEDDPEVGRDRPGQAQPVLAIAVQEPGGIDRASQPGIAGRPDLLGSPDQRLELLLDGVVELEPGRIENLETVVVGRVVRGGDHDPRVEGADSRQMGERGRGDHAQPMDVHPEAGRARGDRGDEHVARAPGVLAHDDRATGADQPLGGRSAEGVASVGEATLAMPRMPSSRRADPRRGDARRRRRRRRRVQ